MGCHGTVSSARSAWKVLCCHGLVHLVRLDGFGPSRSGPLGPLGPLGRFWAVPVSSAWCAWAALGCHGLVRLCQPFAVPPPHPSRRDLRPVSRITSCGKIPQPPAPHPEVFRRTCVACSGLFRRVVGRTSCAPFLAARHLVSRPARLKTRRRTQPPRDFFGAKTNPKP